MNEIQVVVFFISTSSLKSMCLFTFIFQLPIVCNKGMIISTKTNFNRKCKRIHQYSHFIKFLKTQKINLQDSVPFNALNSGGQDEYSLVFVSSDLLQVSLLSNSVCCTHLKITPSNPLRQTFVLWVYEYTCVPDSSVSFTVQAKAKNKRKLGLFRRPKRERILLRETDTQDNWLIKQAAACWGPWLSTILSFLLSRIHTNTHTHLLPFTP